MPATEALDANGNERELRYSGSRHHGNATLESRSESSKGMVGQESPVGYRHGGHSCIWARGARILAPASDAWGISVAFLAQAGRTGL